MSFANICDRCRKVIGDRRGDGEYMAVAILIDGEVAYSLEDACDSCREDLAAAIDAFAHPAKDGGHGAGEPAHAAPERDEGRDRPVRAAAEEKPPAKQEAVVEDGPERQPSKRVDVDSLPNAVVRRFPLPEI